MSEANPNPANDNDNENDKDKDNNDLFDDEDDSDDDKEVEASKETATVATAATAATEAAEAAEAAAVTAATAATEEEETNEASNEKDKENVKMFGSDDSSDDDEEGEGTQTKESTTVGGDNNDDNNNDNDNDGSDEDDEDMEFKEDGIVGKARETPLDTTPATGTHDAHNMDPHNGARMTRATRKEDITIPDIPLPQFQSKIGKTFHVAQLPKLVAIQSDPFSKQSYNANVEEAEYKGRVHNMIRWRYKTSKDGSEEEKKERDEVSGKLIKESNASIIKWSDGSYGLRVGNEFFYLDEFSFLSNGINKKGKKFPTQSQSQTEDAQEQQTNHDNHNISKNFLYLTQKATIDNTSSSTSNKNTTILQAVTGLNSKFIPRPTSVNSAAHKAFALEHRSRTTKTAKIAQYVSFVDPEKQKLERIRDKDVLLKQQNRSGGSGAGIGGRRSYGGNASGKKRSGMNKSYMEEDDGHYDNVNIRQLKDKMDDDDMDYGDDDLSDEEDEWSKRKKRGFEQGRKNQSTARKRQFEDSDEEEDGDEMEDDFEEEESEEEIMPSRSSKTRDTNNNNKKRKAIFDDDDDSE